MDIITGITTIYLAGALLLTGIDIWGIHSGEWGVRMEAVFTRSLGHQVFLSLLLFCINAWWPVFISLYIVTALGDVGIAWGRALVNRVRRH